jgi:predicted TIM-barrel fold metal-dependent hydrolase
MWRGRPGPHVQHRILFGTATWLSLEPANELAAEVVQLVGPNVAADWLHNNALRLLRATP